MARLAFDTPGALDPGPGARLGIDLGDARIGLALSDPDGILAMPLATIPKTTKRKGLDGEDVGEIVALIRQHEVVEVVMGLPVMLDGSFGSSAKKAGDFAVRLRRQLGRSIPVKFADERMTTVLAQARLHEAGRDVRSSRKIIDQAAAVEILQSWLDSRAKYLNS